MNADELITIIHDPAGTAASICRLLRKSDRTLFLLCAAGTKLSDREGISAAGATPRDRRLTPATDAEALVAGKTFSASRLPVSPLGVVSPVVLTRACLRLSAVPVVIVDCGCFVPPAVPHRSVGREPAECPSTGRALSSDKVIALFEQGYALGLELAETQDSLIIAECVPGGTTTALGILTAFGLAVDEFVSSSLPVPNRVNRAELVKKGLNASGHSTADFLHDPLLAVSAAGDPMQCFVAGVAISASRHMPVVLGGGSQMLAVYTLLTRMSRKYGAACFDNLMVATTKWVAFDSAARCVELAKVSGACTAAACPDLRKSAHQGLQAYEQGNVKEGVGAGASMLMAALKGLTAEQIINAVDRCYEELVQGAVSRLS